jgi:hypothetical protein
MRRWLLQCKRSCCCDHTPLYSHRTQHTTHTHNYRGSLVLDDPGGGSFVSYVMGVPGGTDATTSLGTAAPSPATRTTGTSARTNMRLRASTSSGVTGGSCQFGFPNIRMSSMRRCRSFSSFSSDGGDVSALTVNATPTIAASPSTRSPVRKLRGTDGTDDG